MISHLPAVFFFFFKEFDVSKMECRRGNRRLLRIERSLWWVGGWGSSSGRVARGVARGGGGLCLVLGGYGYGMEMGNGDA